ncbi:MAG: type IV conjugative transfer system protein TraL [Betaproteobacteria bacterium AqS2]|uniref:Type IV conjugative transfer system protein TraL n=1 Tax=Candidatus Amphirhobacter heronislandensis TaxID=1732024 RepID=A0A930Y169_9GAMM|nr:type IV conjugative transfer system protein TraL [Betaproteobacteria bacterium AqS2]
MDRVEWRVPLHIEEPPRLLFMDLRQFCLLVAGLGLGIACDATVAGTLAGAVLAKLHGGLTANRHPRYLMHAAYWHLPGWVLSLRRTPPSCLRLFVG